MKATIFGSYVDPSHAEKAAGALLDHGLHNYDISLLVHPGEYDGYPADGEPLPAKASVPPVASQTVGAGYAYADQPVAPATSTTTQETCGAPYTPNSDHGVFEDAPPTTPGSYSVPGVEGSAVPADHTDMSRTDLSAKTGLSTTTGADAGAGAAKGAAVGLGVGVIAALASVFVPGVGLVAGAGALATAIAGAAGATGAGAIAGGAIGFLKDQGVPDDALTVYRDAYGNGGAILGVNLPAGFNRSDIEAIMAKYGAQNIDMYGDYEA